MLNQRTKLVYSSTRGFFYQADIKGIQEAQENVRKAQLDKTVSELQKKITDLQEAMKKETDQIDERIKSLNEYAEKWSEVSSKLEDEINRQRAIEILGKDWESQILSEREDILKQFTDEYVELQKRQKEAYLAARQAELDNPPVSNVGDGGNTSDGKNPPKGDGEDEVEYDEVVYTYNGKEYPTAAQAQAQKQADYNGAYTAKLAELEKKFPNSTKAAREKLAKEYAQAILDRKIEKVIKKNKYKPKNVSAKYTGTDSAQPGETLVGELGSEIVLHKNGTASIVSSPTLMDLQGGEKIFNAEETERILKSKYKPLASVNPKKFKMLNAFANGTSSPMQSMIAAQAVGIASGIKNGLVPALSTTNGQTINQTFNVSLPNITDSSRAEDLFREFEQLQRKATQFFN